MATSRRSFVRQLGAGTGVLALGGCSSGHARDVDDDTDDSGSESEGGASSSSESSIDDGSGGAPATDSTGDVSSTSSGGEIVPDEGWTRLDSGALMPTKPYLYGFFPVGIMQSTGDIWAVFSDTYIFDAATNEWRQEPTNFPTIGQIENSTGSWDDDAQLLWWGPQVPSGVIASSLYAYDPVRRTYTDHGPAYQASLAQAWHGGKIWVVGGYGLTPMSSMPTDPLGSMTDLAATGDVPSLVHEASGKYTMYRGGIDSRTGEFWVISDDVELHVYSPATNAWTKIETTGPKPPFARYGCNGAFALHEARNSLVCWIGANGMCCYDVAPPAVQQTYVLDLETRVWRLGPGPGATVLPDAQQLVNQRMLYDRAHERCVLVQASSLENVVKVWAFEPGVAW